MSKKTGEAIKKARTGAGFTQEQLARKIAGLSASDISLAERGEKDLTQEQLKRIAKATGVTQTSLLNAGKRKTASSSSASNSEFKLTTAEKNLIRAYRKADSSAKKKAMEVLKKSDMSDMIGDLLESAVETFLGSRSAERED